MNGAPSPSGLRQPRKDFSSGVRRDKRALRCGSLSIFSGEMSNLIVGMTVSSVYYPFLYSRGEQPILLRNSFEK